MHNFLGETWGKAVNQLQASCGYSLGLYTRILCCEISSCISRVVFTREVGVVLLGFYTRVFQFFSLLIGCLYTNFRFTNNNYYLFKLNTCY
jgi:hypothetical protein